MKCCLCSSVAPCSRQPFEPPKRFQCLSVMVRGYNDVAEVAVMPGADRPLQRRQFGVGNSFGFVDDQVRYAIDDAVGFARLFAQQPVAALDQGLVALGADQHREKFGVQRLSGGVGHGVAQCMERSKVAQAGA